MQNGWGLEIFARGRGAGKDENSGADDRADAQRGQRPGPKGFLQPLPGASDSAISLSIDLQQRSWFSEVRTVAVGSGDGCDKR